ncbi:arogenate dehydrogenase [Leptolyngbya sp. 'hensonii']|uniref:prephenate/arogenate dehydrogenase n=1 Tax=Leptolyngbya sp. 'hensonii' TaxID=1922337 RepID=UPI00094FADDF|nr:prephenate/arogenate dehydrogenase [Leptolyngbya sp. 'hensonii']OLP19740.1 arogenate dehydrogenase [Leptolyngbya sp. 'hensonii']
MIIGIIGLGLIGGSLAIDLRSQGYSVLGVSRRMQTCETALRLGIVNDASTELRLLAPANLIFICTPISDIQATVIQLLPHLAPTTVLTDVGSVKTSIVKALDPLWPNFVGGHPMAGTAESGIEAAQADLFVNRAYVLTPTAKTPPTALETVAHVVRLLRAKVFFCRPEEHDRAVAWISHLPVVVSAGLIAACQHEADPTILELAQQLASSGFRDTSRVGGGNPQLGVMMARFNREDVLRSLAAYRQHLDQLTTCIEQENWATLEDHLRQTQQARPKFIHE